jgi:hypothetical protein
MNKLFKVNNGGERIDGRTNSGWGRRPPFIGPLKSNRYVLFPHNRYYRFGKR